MRDAITFEMVRAAIRAAVTPADYNATKRCATRLPVRDQFALVDDYIEAAYRTGVRVRRAPVTSTPTLELIA